MSWSAQITIWPDEESALPTHTYSVGGPCTGEAGRRVTLQFRPGGDGATAKIKGFSAAAIQAVIDERNALVDPRSQLGGATDEEIAAYNDAQRLFATALTQLEIGQTLGVKALHARANAGLA